LESLGNKLLVKHLSNKKCVSFPESYDIGISFMYTFLVPKKELDKAIWINIHPAPLPEYGGRNVAYHAIKNNETKFGSTIHFMNEEFDQGEIISKTSFNIPKSATAAELYNLACIDSVKHIMDKIPLVLQNKIKPYIHKKSPMSRYYKQQKINDFIELDSKQQQTLRSLYYPPYYPKIKIGDKTFKIIQEK
jgi:methionyl-tRNA formyltransferase